MYVYIYIFINIFKVLGVAFGFVVLCLHPLRLTKLEALTDEKLSASLQEAIASDASLAAAFSPQLDKSPVIARTAVPSHHSHSEISSNFQPFPGAPHLHPYLHPQPFPPKICPSISPKFSKSWGSSCSQRLTWTWTAPWIAASPWFIPWVSGAWAYPHQPTSGRENALRNRVTCGTCVFFFLGWVGEGIVEGPPKKNRLNIEWILM